MSAQPQNWTKDKLISELKKQRVPHAPNMPKGYYLKTYREKVMMGGVNSSPNSRQRLEFSSDEESTTRRQIYTRSKQYTKTVSLDQCLSEVEKYSDSQLASKLKEYGIVVGPITVTTRSLYQRKLAKAMFEDRRGAPSVSQSSSGVTITAGSDEEIFSSDDERQRVRKEHTPIKPKPIIEPSSGGYHLRPRSTPPVKRPIPPVETRRPVKPVTEDKPTSVRPFRPSWCNVWLVVHLLMLIISVIVAVIVFDYAIYNQTRLIDWVHLKYPQLVKYIRFN